MSGTDFPGEEGMVMAVLLTHSRRLLLYVKGSQGSGPRQLGMGKKIALERESAANDKASSEQKGPNERNGQGVLPARAK